METKVNLGLVGAFVLALGAVLIGIVLGSVWNFALSSKFVWGRY